MGVVKYSALVMDREMDWLPGWKFVDTSQPRRVLVYRAHDGYEISREPGEPVYTVTRKWQDGAVWHEETVEFGVDKVRRAVRVPAVQPAQQMHHKGRRSA